ncbi:50S ribosomal protein L13, chloroplastic-like [Chenopodium quinoa]|uniref:50S ribosomal protein L13, chloroplastic-like n=1 Tax=Chenopodium quinoa TaxID=63459 RepID=UPI000B78BFBD|nr:50S ribosomal protein L13, chloroplastic-like [Chenopodium quinoa]
MSVHLRICGTFLIRIETQTNHEPKSAEIELGVLFHLPPIFKILVSLPCECALLSVILSNSWPPHSLSELGDTYNNGGNGLRFIPNISINTNPEIHLRNPIKANSSFQVSWLNQDNSNCQPSTPQASSKSCTEQWRQIKKGVKKELAIPHVPLAERWMFTLDEAAGPDIWNKTWYPKAADHVPTDKTWYVVDATDLILGRLASIIAVHIRGKNVASFTPTVDMGAFVIVVNADKIAVSGKKRTQKLYRRHSGRPGGLKEETFDQLQKRIPERIVEHAVRGMLPKGRLRRYLFNHLEVYKGPDHPHQAQQPIDLPL